MLNVIPIPALQDNYIWLIHDGRAVVAVDPGQAAPILAWLTERGMSLAAILVTHYHADHVGGVAALAERHGCPVFGPATESIPALTHPLGDGDEVILDKPSLRLRVLGVPGHTRGHLAYFGHGHLFCGDTLFSCGCGRLFEGTAEQLHGSLTKLAALPDDTLICCAHEYTLANIAFAREIDPDNPALDTWSSQALALRRSGQPTLPVGLGQEKAVNPFLRCHLRAIQDAVERETGTPAPLPVQVFTLLRKMKDHF